MNKQLIVFAGILLLMVVGTVFTFKDSNYAVREHYINIEKKVKEEGVYYIVGRDPYVHNSKVTHIFINNKEYLELNEQETYYIKYTTNDGKIYKLTSIEYQK